MNLILRSSALALVLGFGLSLHAQTTQQPDQVPGPQHARGQHRPDPARETKMLSKRLSLTPEQAAQVEPILADRAQRLDALRPAPGTQPDFQAMRSQRRAVLQDTKAKLDAVLTDTQKQELEQMHHGHGPRGPQSHAAPAAPGL